MRIIVCLGFSENYYVSQVYPNYTTADHQVLLYVYKLQRCWYRVYGAPCIIPEDCDCDFDLVSVLVPGPGGAHGAG